ncbi:hypothetical protein J6590_012133 [Homalodisca vitripennis]|nr:hypothetical protein J6590_012133 [Homalodisca vitripennis]
MSVYVQCIIMTALLRHFPDVKNKDLNAQIQVHQWERGMPDAGQWEARSAGTDIKLCTVTRGPSVRRGCVACVCLSLPVVRACVRGFLIANVTAERISEQEPESLTSSRYRTDTKTRQRCFLSTVLSFLTGQDVLLQNRSELGSERNRTHNSSLFLQFQEARSNSAARRRAK